MKKWTWLVCLFLLAFQCSYADLTDLESHLKGAQDRISNGESLFDEDTKPGPFNVTFEGLDKEANGPVFHITYVSNEVYNSYSDWVTKFDIIYYVDGVAYGRGSFARNDKTEVVSERTDENNNKWATIAYDYEQVFDNPDNLPTDYTVTFALKRESMQGYTMFAINDISFDIEYDPEAANNNAGEEGADYTVMDGDSLDVKDQNNRRVRIFGLLLALGGTGAIGGAYLMLRKRKKVVLHQKRPEVKPTPKPVTKQKNIFKAVSNVVSKTGKLAVKGLQKVSKTITGTYDSIQKIGINTRFGRVEVGDITGLTGANQVMNTVKTIDDLCDVINKNKDIGKVWKKVVYRYIDKNVGALKDVVGKGFKIKSADLKKMIHLNQEGNTIYGILKDGISMDDLFDLKSKFDSYKQGTTQVEQLNKTVSQAVTKFNKGADIEGQNFKKLLTR